MTTESMDNTIRCRQAEEEEMARDIENWYQGAEIPVSPVVAAMFDAETFDVLASREAMRQLAESREAIEAGDVMDADELAALLAKRRSK